LSVPLGQPERPYNIYYNKNMLNIKSQIKTYLTDLNRVLDEINIKMKNTIYSNFFYKFIQLLFGDNVHRINTKQVFTMDGEYDKLWFIIKSKRERRLYFNDMDIYNFVVPKRVKFYVDYNGIKFNNYHYYGKICPLHINCSKNEIGYCEEIFLSWERSLYVFYDRNKGAYNSMVCTNKKTMGEFLDSILFIKEI
jgi:hypothetical protein